MDPVPLRGGLPCVRGQHSPVPRVTVARHLTRLRDCAVRGDKKPLQTGSVPRTGFGSGSVAVTPRVHGCYCEPARVSRLWRAILQPMRARRKPPKGGTKGAAPPRGGMPWQGIFLRNAGDASAPLAGENKAAREVRGQTRHTGPTPRHPRGPSRRPRSRRGPHSPACLNPVRGPAAQPSVQAG